MAVHGGRMRGGGGDGPVLGGHAAVHSRQTRPDGRLMSGARWVLTLMFGVNLLNYIDRQILYSVFPPIQTELGLSDTQLGLLASAFMWVYLSTAPIFGLLADRWSRPRLMGLGVAIWSVATAFSGLVRSHP